MTVSTYPVLRSELADRWHASEVEESVQHVRNPATGELLDVFRNGTTGDVDDAVRRARDAFASWRTTTPGQRADLLHAVADRIEDHTDELARLESLNVGKPLRAAREEVPYTLDVVRFMAGAARVAHGIAAGEYAGSSTSFTRREPIGVVGVITPWNYPLLEALWKVAPALAAGNTVVIKPSELTPLTTIRLVELAQAVLPEGVLNLVLGEGTTGNALVEHPAVGLVSLTGDVSTGKKVAGAAAATLKRVHLELGGKAPVLVFGDAPVAETARDLAQFGFVNSGQDCTAPCRLIVEDAVYDEFVEAYCRAVESVTVGDPRDEATAIGPLVSERQRDRVASFVERARAAGATVRMGGRIVPGAGWYYEPTVVTDLAQDAEIVQREVFGPVVTIQRAASDDEMLAMANDVPYGLSASLWTSDLGRTMRFTRDLRFGTVWVNEHLTTVSEMPFGGFGESGYGKELSVHGIDEYSQVKHVLVNPGNRA